MTSGIKLICCVTTFQEPSLDYDILANQRSFIQRLLIFFSRVLGDVSCNNISVNFLVYSHVLL